MATQKSTKKSSSNKKRKGSKKVTSRKESKTDRCGRRPNTQGFRINTHISRKPKSIDQLTKESKLPRPRVAKHIWDMTRKGFVKKDKQGRASWKKEK